MTNKKLQDIVRRLIEFLAKPQQEGGQGMADCADSFLIKLLKELEE